MSGEFTVVTLPRTFYEPSADVVAPRLLGHYLLRRAKTGFCGGIIVETEAYVTDDPAAHSFMGERERNRSMFGPPGHAYVYFIYGNHYCINAVCRPKGIGEAVLIRAIEPTIGLDQMRQWRAVSQPALLTNGPAKLCEALQIDRQFDGADLCDSNSPVLIAENPDLHTTLAEYRPVITTTRIGITKAAERPLRFVLAGSGYISKKASSTG